MSIRVLFITHVSPMAGANRSMFQLIKELKDSYGVYPVVLCPYKNSNICIQDKLKEIEVEFIEMPIQFFKSPNPTFRSFLSHIKYIYRQRFFYRCLKKYSFDIIHSNSSVIDIGVYLSIQLNCKHIWHLREFGDLDYSLYPLGGKLYERFIYSRADSYIAISNIVKNHFCHKIDSNKIRLIYNGIEFVDPLYYSKHNNKVINFVCLGIIAPAKNQIEIVRASYVLINKYKINGFHVTLVGLQSPKYTGEIVCLIKQLHLEDYVSIHSEVDGVQDILKNMDVGIMSSRAEAFGRVTIEYMLQNLLVIANDSGANPELIQHQKSGLIYKHGDYTDLANMMLLSIQNPSIIKDLSSNALSIAHNHFLSVQNTKLIYNLYKSVLKLE